jgi:uncharacterized protein
MKKQILFIHCAGTQGDGQGSYYLANHLQDALRGDHDVFCPIMPDSDSPQYLSWRDKLEKQLKALQGEVMLVGHSLGGSVLLKYLSEEQYRLTVTGLFLAAAPYWGIDEDWQNDEYVLKKHFSSELVRIPRIYLYHSRDDDVVPFKHLQHYAQNIPHAAIRELDHCGHYFRSGLPELINDIRNIM